MSLASSLGVVRNRKGTSTSQPLPSASELAEVADVTPHIRESIATVLSGLDSAVTATLATLLAEGHLLMEDVPGVGKTTLARALAASIDCSVGRIQFAPDLLPSDVTKASIFRAADASLEFRAGPICANVVIADEINRASPKTQSALLEAMARHAVTVDGHTRSLPRPFLVVATQNPLEMEGTYPLPEAQRDRFMTQVSVGYPSPRDEMAMLEAHEGLDPLTGDVLSTLVPLGETGRAWALVRTDANPRHRESADATVRALQRAGWRATTATTDLPLADAWSRLVSGGPR